MLFIYLSITYCVFVTSFLSFVAFVSYKVESEHLHLYLFTVWPWFELTWPFVVHLKPSVVNNRLDYYYTIKTSLCLLNYIITHIICHSFSPVWTWEPLSASNLYLCIINLSDKTLMISLINLTWGLMTSTSLLRSGGVVKIH